MGRGAAGDAAVRLRRQIGALASATETALLAVSALLTALQSLQAQVATAVRVLVGADPASVRAIVERQLGAALRAFEDADRRAAAVVYDALLGVPLSLGGPESAAAAWPVRLNAVTRASDLSCSVATPSPAPSQPAGIAVWWAGLTPTSRHALSTAVPWVTAGLDGVPPRVRDQVNRRRLAYAIAQAEAGAIRERGSGFTDELTTGAARLLPWPISAIGHLVTGGLHTAARRLRELQALCDVLRGRGKELLVFDPLGDGQAVVSTGDVESGRSVAVIVPGLDTTLDDAPALVAQADRLVAAAGTVAGATVAIAWLGYDAPNLVQVAGDEQATAGAGQLAQFADGIRATGLTRQHVTVIGHSYGTLVAGIAARHSLAPDDLVLLASPGVEAASADQLHVPAGHVWAARAVTDPIQLVFWPARLGRLIGLPVPQVFGPDPAAPAFGAHHFAIGGAWGHSGYFTAGSQSLDNLGRIVTGRQVVP